jgi:hypothetical protein
MMRTTPLGLGVLIGVTAAVAPSAASARPATPAAADQVDDPAFHYESSAPPDHARAAIEEVGILVIGYIEYVVDTSNAQDQTLGYAWRDFRSKLVLDSLAMDNNRFGTNWLTHPGAGILYYSAARANRVPMIEAFTFAVAASTLWEYVGEFREQAAINDLVVTPVSGVPIGESLTQLGSFFHRSRRTTATSVAGWIFATFKSAHDEIDDLTPAAPSAYDDLGLDADSWHRFHVRGSVGVTRQASRDYSDGRIEAATRLVTLPGYGRAGAHEGTFHAGEVSALDFRAAQSEGRLVDLQLASSVLPAGWYWQNVGQSERGSLDGNGVVAGFHVAAEYGVHDYDRSDGNATNRLADIGAGATVEHSLYTSGLVLRTRADALFDFAGVDAYALAKYRRAHGDYGLASVMANQSYYPAYGATLRPTVEITAGALDFGGSMRIDLFQSIRGVDVEGVKEGEEVSSADSRTTGRAWVGVSPSRHVRISVSAERNTRAGRVGDQSDSRAEVGMYGGAEVVF